MFFFDILYIALFIAVLLHIVHALPNESSDACEKAYKSQTWVCFKDGVCIGDNGVTSCSDPRIENLKTSSSILVQGNLVTSTENHAFYKVKKFYLVDSVISGLPENFTDLNGGVVERFVHFSVEEQLLYLSLVSKHPVCVFPRCKTTFEERSILGKSILSTLDYNFLLKILPVLSRGFESFGLSRHTFRLCCRIRRQGAGIISKKPRKCLRRS